MQLYLFYGILLHRYLVTFRCAVVYQMTFLECYLPD